MSKKVSKNPVIAYWLGRLDDPTACLASIALVLYFLYLTSLFLLVVGVLIFLPSAKFSDIAKIFAGKAREGVSKLDDLTDDDKK